MRTIAGSPTRVGLTTKSLLLSNRARNVHEEPFFYFYVDHYLPAEVYRALLEGFPHDADFAGYAARSKHGNKRILSSSHHSELFQSFMNSHPFWQALFSSLGSEEFINDLYGLVRRELVKARGLGGLKIWRVPEHLPSGFKRALAQPVELHFEFSRLTEGSYILPHTDTPSKLASLLLYFPDPRWKTQYGGGTVFYRPASGTRKKNWENRTVPFEDLVQSATIDFVPNRLLVFLKSSTSYHAVPLITCPQEMVRNSVNINYLIFRRASRA